MTEPINVFSFTFPFLELGFTQGGGSWIQKKDLFKAQDGNKNEVLFIVEIRRLEPEINKQHLFYNCKVSR